jgi:glycosyltransferase involved in cell wall biosynthesis
MIKPIAVSFNVAESLSEIYGGHEIKVIHNRIPCPNEDKKSKSYYRNMLSLPTSKILLISVARMVPAKNHMMLLEAFSRLLKEVPKAHLILIGDGVLRGNLEQKTRDRGIADHVSFCGKVNDPTPYLRAADLFVLSSRREGLPVSLLEAMREGLPVVTTKAGGIPEVVSDSVNGYLVNIGDTEGFTTGLIRLISSGTRLEFGRKARQRINKDFSIEKSAREYENIYKEAIR